MFGLRRKMKAKRKETRRLIPHLAHLAPTHCTSEVCVTGEGWAETGTSDSCGMSRQMFTKLFLNFCKYCHLALHLRSGNPLVLGSRAAVSSTECRCWVPGADWAEQMWQRLLWCGSRDSYVQVWGHWGPSPSVGTPGPFPFQHRICSVQWSSGLPEAVSKVIEFRIFLAFHLWMCVSKTSQDLQWMLDNF